jgi:hypothetical protein
MLVNIDTKLAYSLITHMSDYTLKSYHKDLTEYLDEFPKGSKNAPIFLTMIENEMQVRLEAKLNL